MSFWENATTEQKLAQIDGGIECGMNAPQIAMNCAATVNQILGFSGYHGRRFRANNFNASSIKHMAERGRVDAAKRISARTGTLGDAAFSIFGNAPQHSEDFELEWPA